MQQVYQAGPNLGMKSMSYWVTLCRLFLYEDGCYAYYPLKLPEVHADGTKQFGEGARFEMGLMQT